MRLLLTLLLVVTAAIGLAIALSAVTGAVAGTAGKAFEEGPMKSGFVPRIAFVLLWALIFGVAIGWIGAS
ncbi:hypothetical protein [Tropicimonas sp.]|uniref:hypothetical protein n=1 Tax=Tropicimonas sp. TaxID=2067044 RepID=UPI003A892A44